MPGRSSRETPHARFYAKFRREGMAIRDAKLRARARAARYDRVLELKKLGFTSKNGLNVDREEDKERKIVTQLRAMNPRYTISVKEASLLSDLQNEITNLLITDPIKFASMVLHPDERSIYPISHCIEDYARVRFIGGKGHPKTQREVESFILTMMKHRFGKILPEWQRRVKYLGASEKMLPGNGDQHFADFFSRITLENGLGRGENQRIGVVLALNFLLGMKTQTNTVAMNAARALRKGPSRGLANDIKSRIEGFSKKPPIVQERIIQEQYARLLGSTIAQEMLETYREYQKANLETLAEFPEDQGIFVHIREMAWIIRCLKKKSNHRVLIQKAIEWAADHQA